MRRSTAVLLGAATATLLAGGTSFATPPSATPSPTTLDACGYFSGTQTPADGASDGTEHGTWTGVLNQDGSLVASLGEVKGSYEQTTSRDSRGNVTGTETFRSSAGKISQSFTYGPDVVNGFSVSVTATKALSFLTSNTDGACYSGPSPRP